MSMSCFAISRWKLAFSIALGFALLEAEPTKAGELLGPARFCGYAPIIDLLPGEKVTTLKSGIHAGSFRWKGAFGSFEVMGIGWGARPNGRMVNPPGPDRPARFAGRRVRKGYQVAIWNGAYGAAFFTSTRRFRAAQLAAVERVRLFQEGQEPTGCDLRTIFSWE